MPRPTPLLATKGPLNFLSVVSVHESDSEYDSSVAAPTFVPDPEGHVRIAFGSADPDRWTNVTLAHGVDDMTSIPRPRASSGTVNRIVIAEPLVGSAIPRWRVLDRTREIELRNSRAAYINRVIC